MTIYFYGMPCYITLEVMNSTLNFMIGIRVYNGDDI